MASGLYSHLFLSALKQKVLKIDIFMRRARENVGVACPAGIHLCSRVRKRTVGMSPKNTEPRSGDISAMMVSGLTKKSIFCKNRPSSELVQGVNIRNSDFLVSPGDADPNLVRNGDFSRFNEARQKKYQVIQTDNTELLLNYYLNTN
jgi:hypothetical protein